MVENAFKTSMDCHYTHSFLIQVSDIKNRLEKIIKRLEEMEKIKYVQ